MDQQQPNLYELVGGDEVFRQLVEIFYARVDSDPRLRFMFPEDIEAGKKWQFLFLTQYFGGPARYVAERGHPRLRMRHMPFPINKEARDAWLEHMLAAVDAMNIQDPMRTEMRTYFERASEFMINLESAPSSGNTTG